MFGPGAGNIDPRTGVAFAALGFIAYYPMNEGNLFITSVFTIAGGGTAVAPALTDIGEAYQLSLGAANSQWGPERTSAIAGTDVQARIVDVLDAQGTTIRTSGEAGVSVVFTIDART